MYYTIKGRKDGFGAQYHAIMSGIAFCKFMGYTYIHTSFKEMEHNENIEELNTFIGISEQKVAGKILSQSYADVVHWAIQPSDFYTETILEKIRKYYYSSEKPHIRETDIAIHIRRGDVSSLKNQIRFTPNELYKDIILTLKEKYPDYRIDIFSEGSTDDFEELKMENVTFRLNEDIRETFHSLVTAKVLVMSKSSLSYSAAILNKNTIFYEPFVHKPLKHWNVIRT